MGAEPIAWQEERAMCCPHCHCDITVIVSWSGRSGQWYCDACDTLHDVDKDDLA